jgi:ribonuclease P/MRP protein subunit RPP40
LSIPDLDAFSELATSSKADAMELATDMYEWLSLARLDSPRIHFGDNIDPYLSGYQVPRQKDKKPASVRKVSWRGFIQPSWVRQLLVDVIIQLPSKSWFSLSSTAFATSPNGDSAECVLFRPPTSPEQYMLWDVKRTC